jgi:hypothetical protein
VEREFWMFHASNQLCVKKIFHSCFQFHLYSAQTKSYYRFCCGLSLLLSHRKELHHRMGISCSLAAGRGIYRDLPGRR